jgi:hypothetical protein
MARAAPESRSENRIHTDGDYNSRPPHYRSGNCGAKPGTLQLYLTKLSRLDGYLARTPDPPPRNTVVWRGLRRLADIQIGAKLATYG